MPNYGIVIIGRNEAKRLPVCIQSVPGIDTPVIYVDSGSTDNSIDIANKAGIHVHELDPSRPFSAARARNEGFDLLLAKYSDINAVQFIDGDCQLVDGWLEKGFAALNEDNKRAAIVGHLQEMYPEKSVYNRLCSMEWKSAPSDVLKCGSFGGISMIRTSIFQELGGFNPDIIAGEEPNFCMRMNSAGYHVTKIDVEMAIHDAEITKFSQWWQRAVREGHSIGQRAMLNKQAGSTDMQKEIRSTWLWGLILPFIIIGGAIPSNGLSLLLAGGYLVLFYRIYQYRRRMNDDKELARLYAKYTIIGKFPTMTGLAKFYYNRLFNSYRIIEYK